MALVIRKLAGGAKIGTVVADAIVDYQESLEVAWSEERLADGSLASDHSQVQPERYTINGGVSNIPSPLLDSLLAGGVGGLTNTLKQTGAAIADNVSPVALNLNTRRKDAEDDLKALVKAREEFDFIWSEGKVTMVAESLSQQRNFGTGDAYVFTLVGREILRGNVATLSNPSELSESLVGSGMEVAKGPSRTTATSLELP